MGTTADDDGEVDWGEILATLSTSLSGLVDRIEAIEQRLNALDGGTGTSKGKKRKLRSRRATWIGPSHGEGDLRYSQPKVTIR
jgi:hypothetical protein